MRTVTRLLVVAALLALASTAAAQECDEQVLFEVSDGQIDVMHSQALYNCCSWIEFELLQTALEIDIFEREQLMGGGCDCLCCFDMTVSVAGLAPGDYTVRIWKNCEHLGGIDVLYGTWSVHVEGYSEPFIDSNYIPCAETGAPEEPRTWGTIKALYRSDR
jgi:hypothetical protein